MQPFKIFLPIWGEKHLRLLEKALLKSLSWSKNLLALEDAQFVIVSSCKYDADRVASKIFEVIDVRVEPIIIPELMHIGVNKGEILLNPLKDTIKECLKDKTPMLMATPDYVFGNGTIDTLRSLGEEPGSVIGLAHMRVNPNLLEILNHEMTNEQLVGTGMKFAHPTWIFSEESKKDGFTYYGGISWKKINNTVAVRHRLPAPFFANFEKSDLDFFNAKHDHPHTGTFALWDHYWQSHLFKEKRFRYIGSSDLALMLEVTESHANIPPSNPLEKTNRDEYCNHWLHNDICQQFLTVFRGV